MLQVKCRGGRGPLGMRKDELVDKVQVFAGEKLGLKITKKFLQSFPTVTLYGAMRRAQRRSSDHEVFQKWVSEREHIPF